MEEPTLLNAEAETRPAPAQCFVFEGLDAAGLFERTVGVPVTAFVASIAWRRGFGERSRHGKPWCRISSLGWFPRSSRPPFQA